ncbi:hypothetical protein AAZX31_07G108100 [Glycine max]
MFPLSTFRFSMETLLATNIQGFGSRGVETGIIEGVEKDEKHILLPIQEDVYKSCESISTLASDLFEDVRASIQKSSKKSTPSTSNIKVSSSPSVPLFQTHDSSEKVGLVSRNKVNSICDRD